MTETTYEHGTTTEEEQIGLAPLLVGYVDFCADALPLGTSRSLTSPHKAAKCKTPWPFTGWIRPDGTAWPAEDFREHLMHFIEDRCGFTPNRLMLIYIASHVLAPYYTRDELVRFMLSRLEQCPGGRVDLEELYADWRALPVRVPMRTPPGGTFRTFKASEAQWRAMLEERGYELSSDALLGWARKAPKERKPWTRRTATEDNRKEQV